MRATWHVVTLLVFALILAAAGSCTRTSAKPSDPVAARVVRGEYLITVMGCGDCHTPGTLFGAPDPERRFAGSELGWKGPWGVTYARNLTPDPETGLGRWSEEQIVTALRRGVRPDRSPLRPPMPWANTTRLTDEDALALAAYLKSLPAVAHRVPDAVPPGQAVSGSVIEFPMPSPWDAPRSAPNAAPPAGGTAR